VIPTAFVSWTGDSLDKKTPLLRSVEALSKQAVRILAGSRAGASSPPAGPSRVNLIDRNFFFARPD
jgi:glutamine synthetase